MIRRVLAALDRSPRMQLVFDAAAEVAARFTATMWPLAVVWVPPEFPAAAAGSQADPLPAKLEATARAEIGSLRSSLPGLDLRPPVVRFGVPWRKILDAAEELDVDLVVMGSHGYGGFDRLVGTTAAHVVNRARRSVLVVHAAQRQALASGDPYR
ncbi:MAG TPA: universal stress protein [Polyangiaceae bacterium]